MKEFITKSIFISYFLLSVIAAAFSQDCQSKYLSLTYKGTTFETFSHAAYTPSNEIIGAGYLLDYNGVAHLAKYTKNGTPIWSNYYSIKFFTFYNPTFFSRVRFNDFVLTPDGGIVVVGTMVRYYDNRANVVLSDMALLAKIDKYGNVEWSRTYLPSIGLPDISFSNIYQTTDGDFIVYMANDKGPSFSFQTGSYNRVIRFSASGQVKWVTSLLTGAYHAGGTSVFFKRCITQLANKNIVVGDAVYKSAPGTENFKISDGRLHFFSLDYKTGKMSWESDYPYTIPVSDSFFVPDINHVTELPDGRLSFTTSLYLSTPSQPVLAKKPVTIITDNKGVAQKLISYYNSSGNNYKLVDVITGNTPGNKNILLQFGNMSVVTSADKEGAIHSNNGYAGIFPANCFATGSRGHSIFMSDYNSLQFKLLITNANGQTACADTPAEVLSEAIPAGNDNTNPVITDALINNETDYRSYFVDYEYTLQKKVEYPLVTTIDCEDPIECCKDFIDTFNIRQVKICEGSSYTLPGNNMVKDSGTYYVVYKTATGCDSVTYHRVTVDKSLSVLKLAMDTCLTGKDTIVLKATEGYNGYNWMGGTSTSTSSFKIKAPGVYWVSVTNFCGTKKDSIEIFDRCDFPIYMPDAFTPNGDNLNDDFGVPKQNKNRLIDFKIYNRWGQIIFQTNQISKRWDGKFKNQLLNSDIFVYHLVMEGLSGNRITHKGKILLIR
jgi:gliding motility-associated-like protein